MAAILFPVFAQAKAAAKKTAGLSNAKQIGTSTAIYLNDNDDTMPNSVYRYFGGWYPGLITPCPADVVANGGWNDPGLIESGKNIVGNSILIYTKNQDIFDVPGATRVNIGDVFNGTPTPSNLTFNGDMSQLNSSAVDSPSVAVLWWGGQGTTTVMGRTAANPQLNCQDPTQDSCRWNNGGPPQSGLPDGLNDFFFGYNNFDPSYVPYFYGHGVAFVHADTSAKWRRVGNVESTTSYSVSCETDPFAQVFKDSTGYEFTYFTASRGDVHDCSADVAPWQYVGYFRPDKTIE
ncbi:MAG TPA: hypothetical protein VG944_00475 [Fimbriimonas sp.]|nr:hypothetical protein [Fimbriimonas sp.]